MSNINRSTIEEIRILLIEGEESGESNLSIDDIVDMEIPLSED